MKLVDSLSTDVLRDRMNFVVKIEDMIIQKCLRCYGHVIRRDINSQIHEVMEVEISEKKKKGRPRKLWEECVKKDLERYGLRIEDAYGRKKWRELSKNYQPRPAGIMALKQTLLLCVTTHKSGKS